MIQKFASAVLSLLLLLVSFARCTVDIGIGAVKELYDNKEGILQELGEIWDGLWEEIGEWSESFATQSITNDHDLIENREEGMDHDVGPYEAGYREFDGKEYIFRGTSPKQKEESGLRAVYFSRFGPSAPAGASPLRVRVKNAVKSPGTR